MAKKFNHEIAYRGEKLLERLKDRRITICGVGALGSNLADTLARQGVPSLRVIDMDRVEEHNVSTQIFGDGDVGALKVNALKNRLFQDVGIEVETFGKELTDSTVKKFLKDSDLVIDTFDNSASRQIIHDWCQAHKLPCLHAGMFEDYGEVIWDDKYKVPQDAVDGEGDVCDYPLARNLAMLVVSVAAEEIIDHIVADEPREKNWTITLKDLAIRSYK